ncbi:translin-associated protein X [Anopheles ziemanni]|uniref:translin-associated protein X n=1 Tax=Anopheles coustani TaxID=139045 RepID=UPI002659094C|nr:translin-associated protein X [Anopheles coustani]XP_058172558.1 translin-associated protein X [Anopheles ziemanni]
MTGRGNRRHHFGKPGGRRGKDNESVGSSALVDENNLIIQCFRGYASELDAKHDRYERIVKCSRDITIESKRIIFLLHTIDPRKNNQQKVCDEAKVRLENIFGNHFAVIAKELQGQDPYQYARAYTNGMQEFIEAFTFYEYSSGQDISHWEDIQKKLEYTKIKPISSKNTENEEPRDCNIGSEALEHEDKNPVEETFTCKLQPLDFTLGLGDLSGEIMRKCINSLGSGNAESCFEHCRFLQELYAGFLSVISPRSRDFSHKMITLKQSLLKSENVCYNVTVRGGEAAKWGTTDDSSATQLQFHASKEDDDEGVFF